MPDTSFSWPALREHLRKHLWVYLVGILLSLVITELLWTATRPRLSNAQCVLVYLTDSYSNPEALDDVAEEMLESAQVFDESLKKVEFQSLLYSGDDYSGNILLMTRLAIGEGDAFLASASAMEALVRSDALLPLDDAVAGGWLADSGLEPYYVETQNEETGETKRWLAGLRLDRLDALLKRQAFNNDGAFLCVTQNGGNVETTMKALEMMIKVLTEDSHAGTEDS